MEDQEGGYVIPTKFHKAFQELLEGTTPVSMTKYLVECDIHNVTMWYSLSEEQMKEYQDLHKKTKGTNDEVVMDYNLKTKKLEFHIKKGAECSTRGQ